VAEYVDEKWRDCLKGVKAFKSNWTKAVNHSGISLEEQVDLIQELLQRDYVFGLADWEGVLKNQLVALKEIVQRVEIAKATPVRSRQSAEMLDEKEDRDSERMQPRVLFASPKADEVEGEPVELVNKVIIRCLNTTSASWNFLKMSRWKQRK